CTNNVYAILNSMLTVGIFNAPVNCGTSATYSLNTGTMYYISVINCPLDHLLILLSIPITILAFYRFRKYQFE
uniref:hypothetical protein n=1 Tax=Pedobacter sp. UBA5917 TaxID=1947061 RepID=UPI0025F5F8EA